MTSMDTNKLKILAIDDQRDNLVTLKAVLGDALPGCRLLTALDGLHGISLAQAEDPDAILLDIIMPDMDGFEVCRRLKAEDRVRDIPVIFLTAMGTDRALRVEALEAGAEAFLAKPPDEQELVAQLRAMAKLKAANRVRRLERSELAELVDQRTHDLTVELAARKRADERLIQSEKRYRELFENMNTGFVLFELVQDDDGAPIDLTILTANEGFETTTGLKLAEAIGNRLTEVLPGIEEDEADWIGTYGKVALTGEARRLEQGSELLGYHYEVSAFRPAPKQCAVTFLDVTERKRAEKKVRTNEAQLSNALEMARAGSWEYDVGRDTFTFNDLFYKIFRTTAAEAGGYQMSSAEYARRFCHPDEVARVGEEIRRSIEATDPNYTWQTEHRFLHADGEVGHMSVRILISKDSRGRTVKTYGINQDITERRQAEELNRRVAERAKEQRNLIAKLSFEDVTVDSSVDEALEALTTQFAEILKVERTSVWLLSDDDKLLTRRMLFDTASGVDSQVDVLNTAEFPSYFAALYKDSQIGADDAQNDPRTRELNDSYFIPLQISSMLDSAIQRDGRIIGVLSAEHRGPPRRWQADEESLSSSLTNLVSQLLANAERKRAEADLRRSEATVRKKLKSIVEPEGDISGLELSDIMDLEIMQSMMEEFYRATGMLGAVLDLSGKVLVSYGWQDICTKFHRCHPDTLKNCLESDTVLTQGVPPGTVKAYQCRNNMWDMVTPLMVGSRHVGNVFFGQFFYEGEAPDVELFRAQARQHGFDETEYLAALDRVPRFHREEAEAGLLFYLQLASMVAKLSYNGIKQARMIAEQRQAEESLRTYAERLKNLHRIDQAILEASDSPESITQEAILSLRDLLHCHRVSVGMLDSERKEVRVFAATGDADSVVQTGQIFPEALYGELDTLRQKKLEIIENCARAETARATMKDIQDEGVRSCVNAPIVSARGLIGVLSIGWSAPRTITSEEQETVSEVASQISIAIEHARLLQETKRHAKDLEDTVRLRTAQLEATNRELEAFAYSVSHDLRAPLRGIDGFSMALLEDYREQLDDTGKDYLNRVRAGTQRMGRLIDDLLKLSRLTRTNMQRQRLDLGEMARQIVIELRRAEPDRRAEFEIAPGLTGSGDRALVEAALENLLRNAWKFTGNCDRARIELGVTEHGDERVYHVRDNGAGFDMAYADKLFRPFQRLHDTTEFPGTGIGLAIVHRVVLRHGGRIWAEGEVDGGATFYFTLQAKTASASEGV